MSRRQKGPGGTHRAQEWRWGEVVWREEGLEHPTHTPPSLGLHSLYRHGYLVFCYIETLFITCDTCRMHDEGECVMGRAGKGSGLAGRVSGADGWKGEISSYARGGCESATVTWN